MAKQLVTRFATMYRPALASRRLLSIKGVRDSDRGFESSGFYGSCDVRGLTTYGVATGRFFNISGVRDCDRGFGFNACHDVRRFTTKIYNGAGAMSFSGVATGRFFNISGVGDCEGGFGFNACHDVRRFFTKIYNGARAMSFSERLMNPFKVTRMLRLAFRFAMVFEYEELKKMHFISPARLEEDPNCLKVYIRMPTPGLKEDMRMFLEHDTVYVESIYEGKTFICIFELPDIASTRKIYIPNDIKGELEVESGWITLTIPKLKEEEMVYEVHMVRIVKAYVIPYKAF